MLLLKMVFKFTGCCTALLLNFLYLFCQLLMFICVLLPLSMSVNIRLMHKFSGMQCHVTGQAVPSVGHAFVQSKMKDVDPLTLMMKVLDLWNLRTAHPMTMSHLKGHIQQQCWDASDLCEFHFKHFLFFGFRFVILEYNETHCMTQENYMQFINW